MDQFLPLTEPEPWQEFRDDLLWKAPIDSVFTMNASPMNEMFNQVFPKYSNKGLRHCVDLMMRQSDVQLSDKEVRFCYGMCRMTIRDEVEKHDDYDNLKYVEFLEFIARCAHAKY